MTICAQGGYQNPRGLGHQNINHNLIYKLKASSFDQLDSLLPTPPVNEPLL
jgi:hypothetical protein